MTKLLATQRRIKELQEKMSHVTPEVRTHTTQSYVAAASQLGLLHIYPTATGSLVVRVSSGNTPLISLCSHYFPQRDFRPARKPGMASWYLGGSSIPDLIFSLLQIEGVCLEKLRSKG